ncbi:MAG: preprotein translocase subunit YajC [Ruminococcaceae bacterium]|nr:preprotein translocase subunit YajC [Oscillospiraceae bacterium]
MGNPMGSLIMIVAMLLIFYFLLIRPQKKQEKEKQAMLNSLEVGDEVTTIGGIVGEIVSVREETVMIETGKDKTKIRVLRSAISRVDVKASEKEAL